MKYIYYSSNTIFFLKIVEYTSILIQLILRGLNIVISLIYLPYIVNIISLNFVIVGILKVID